MKPPAFPAFEIDITPTPSPAERGAILIAVKAALSQSADTEEPRLPAWAAAGRREAVLGATVKSRLDLGQDNDRMRSQ